VRLYRVNMMEIVFQRVYKSINLCRKQLAGQTISESVDINFFTNNNILAQAKP